MGEGVVKRHLLEVQATYRKKIIISKFWHSDLQALNLKSFLIEKARNEKHLIFIYHSFDKHLLTMNNTVTLKRSPVQATR